MLGRRRGDGHAVGFELVTEQRDVGEVAGTVAGNSCAELDEADAADFVDTVECLDLQADVDVDPAARERCLRRVRVDDGIGILCSECAGRRADQPVEQAAEEHEEDGDECDDDRRRGEPAGPPTQLFECEVHIPHPRAGRRFDRVDAQHAVRS